MKFHMTKKGYGSIPSADREAESQESVETTRFRCIASQCCGVLASNCLRFTSSTFSGFHIILIAELHRANSEIDITLDQLTWIASLNFLVPIGSIANGFVAQRMGSRFVMMAASLSYVLTWLLYNNASSVSTVLAARILYSLTSGAVKTPSSTYITEISEPQMRGSFLATYSLAGTFGTFFTLLVGGLVYWRTVTLINIIFPIIAFVILHFVPDSPTWLASKGRYEEAHASLSWLRGWLKPGYMGSEFEALVDNAQKSGNLSPRPYKDMTKKEQSSSSSSSSPASSSSLLSSSSSSSFCERLSQSFKPFAQRSFYAPLGTVSLIFFIHYFSGVAVIQVYSMVLFRQMQSPMHESVATAIMGAMRVVGAFIVLFSIQRAGKKKLVFISLLTAGTCYLAISGSSFVVGHHQQDDLEVDADPWLWVGPVALILAVFANAAGAENVVQMLNSEIFPVSIRYIGSAIGLSVGVILQSAMTKIFLYLVDAIGLTGVFFYFAVMNGVAYVVYRRVFPETEGRSLEEIEEHYRSGKDLKDSRNINTETL